MKPYFKTQLGKLYCGDALEVLKQLPDESVDVVITSPPYWAKRVYSGAEKIWGGDPNCEHEWVEKPLPSTKLGREGHSDPKYKAANTDKPKPGMVCRKCGAVYTQLGLEPTPQMFVEHLVEIFREVKRVLKPTGSLFVNIDDTWAGGGAWNSGGGRSYKDNEWERAWAVEATVPAPVTYFKGVKERSLCLVPELFAIKMVYEEGWILREKIIWSKKVHIYKDRTTIGNAMPESVKSRFAHTWEYIFHFTKKPSKYYFNLDAVRVPLKAETIARAQRGVESRKLNGTAKGMTIESKKKWQEKVLQAVSGGALNSKYLSKEAQNTRSPGGRLAKIIAEGKIDQVALVREAITNVNAYLKQKLKEKRLNVKKLAEMTGIKETQLAHYFRTDLSGAALPPREVWNILKPILDLDDYENHIREEYRSVIPSPHPLGANPGDVVQINVRPFKDAHFATFPLELPELLIKAACPPFVCSKCGRPYEPVKEEMGVDNIDWQFYGADADGEYHGEATKEYEKAGAENASEVKRRILQSMKKRKVTKGYRPSCSCNAGWVPGVVLDPFAGAGTTLIVAEKMGRRWIGIEISQDYCEIIKKRFEREVGDLIKNDRLERWLKWL